MADGLFAQLTPEQQKLALAYRGPENHGADEFKRAVCVVCGAPAEKGEICLMCWVEGE